MRAAPLRDPPPLGTSVSGPSAAACAPVGAPAVSFSDQATTRPVVTESRQVVDGTSLLSPRRQK